MARNVGRTFRKLLRDALSTSGRTVKEIEPRVGKIRAFVEDHKSLPALEAMLPVYLDEYERLEARNDSNAGYISASIFEHVFGLWVAETTFFDPLFQRCVTALIDEKEPGADDRIYRRYQTLNTVERSKILNHVKRKHADKKNSLSLFEILMDLFSARNRRLPETDDELFAFSPMPDANLEQQLKAKAQEIKQAFDTRNLEDLENGLRSFSQWTSEGGDIARSFQIFIWCRAVVMAQAGNPNTTDAWIDNELYLISLQRALRCALDSGYGFVQRHFLTDDEIDVVLDPLGGSKYFSDYADRLYPFATNGNFSAGKNFLDLVVLHLNLLLFAAEMDFFLASAEERDEVLNRLIQDGQQLRSRRWPIHTPSLAQLGGHVRIGTDIEGIATIVYHDDARKFAITWKGLDHFLFFAEAGALGEAIENQFIKKLVEGTQHLLVLIPAFFELLQYIAAFITGGILGLVEEFVENVVGDVAVSVAERYTDNRLILTVAGAISPVSLAIPSFRLAKAGAKAVRKVVTLRRAPKSNVPRARVVGRGRKRGTPSTRSRSPLARPKTPTAGRGKAAPKYKRANYYNTRGAYTSTAGVRLSKRTGLRPADPLSDTARSRDWGQYQVSVAGPTGYVAYTQKGGKVEPDGLAHAEVKGKLDVLEAKHENDLVTPDDISQSTHFKYAEGDRGSKIDQMKRYAQYAKENAKYVDKVRYICSSKAVYDVYASILRDQLLPRRLRKYIVIELDPRAPDV